MQNRDRSIDKMIALALEGKQIKLHEMNALLPVKQKLPHSYFHGALSSMKTAQT